MHSSVIMNNEYEARGQIRPPLEMVKNRRAGSFCFPNPSTLIVIDTPWFKLVYQGFLAWKWMFLNLKKVKKKIRASPGHFFSFLIFLNSKHLTFYFYICANWKTSLNQRVCMKMKMDMVWEKKLLAGGLFTIFQWGTNFCTLPRSPLKGLNE